MIGHEFNWNRGYSLNYKTQSSIIPDFQAFTNFLALNGGATFSGIGGGIDEEALEGYFMRANYNYDNKYYVTGIGSYRRFFEIPVQRHPLGHLLGP